MLTLNQDVCRLIIGAIDKRDAACLAAVARTCRFLSEHALDRLWASPPDAACLALLISPEYFIITEKRYTDESSGAEGSDPGRLVVPSKRVFTMSQPHPPDVWLTERFVYYSNRVIELKIGRSSKRNRILPVVDDSVYTAWALCPYPLFPRLSKLRHSSLIWHEHNSKALTALSLRFFPSLTRLYLRLAVNSSVNTEATRHLIGGLSSSLTSLNIEWRSGWGRNMISMLRHPDEIVLSELLSDAFANLSNLQQLRCDVRLPASALTQLGSLPRLELLVCGFFSLPPALTMNEKCFISLRDLSIHCPSLDKAAEISFLMINAPLTRLEVLISPGGHLNMDKIAYLTRCLAVLRLSQSLCELLIRNGELFSSSSGTLSDLIAIMSPLATFSCLETIMFSKISFTINNASAFLSACPLKLHILGMEEVPLVSWALLLQIAQGRRWKRLPVSASFHHTRRLWQAAVASLETTISLSDPFWPHRCDVSSLAPYISLNI